MALQNWQFLNNISTDDKQKRKHEYFLQLCWKQWNQKTYFETS